ncbi:hypothetical protein [Pseudomonas sp. Irchel 3A5]|uniref:hypothetical protein n=1 Tax=Pseudomonas sp. Irchel 3A5 TaxID=2008911 RepID=UPI000BA2F5B9|nr:hypothetical protein [Pseudomonas sp. Irchel 3A5]
MKTHAGFTLILTAAIALASITVQAKNARYYRWQGADRIVCAQTSPGEGWKRLNGSFIKPDCSI